MIDERTLGKALDVARDAARSAGDLLTAMIGTRRTVQFKGERDMVTDADKASEGLILLAIRSEFPSHSICAEEQGQIEGQGPGAVCEWFIDPLDGTTNYAHGLPFFAVSIGLFVDGLPAVGVVYSPVSGELYSAASGRGAFLNGSRIHVSSTSAMAQALVATGFPYDMADCRNNNMDVFARVIPLVQEVRRFGVASLDLAYVACGRFDAYWEPGLAPWDMAAGAVIVGEAGGVVTNFAGGPFRVGGKQVLAANCVLHQSMLHLVSGQGTVQDASQGASRNCSPDTSQKTIRSSNGEAAIRNAC
ncbi:MAG: inositol monophosphatase family protein [Clostridia bacterium]|nr:inositol monophosphatase family protein [Clostridia bacterium]